MTFPENTVTRTGGKDPVKAADTRKYQHETRKDSGELIKALPSLPTGIRVKSREVRRLCPFLSHFRFSLRRYILACTVFLLIRTSERARTEKIAGGVEEEEEEEEKGEGERTSKVCLLASSDKGNGVIGRIRPGPGNNNNVVVSSLSASFKRPALASPPRRASPKR